MTAKIAPTRVKARLCYLPMARRRSVYLAALVALATLVLIFGGYYAWLGAEIAASFAAKTVCSCIFVAERAAPFCIGDDLAAQGMEWVATTINDGKKTVEANALQLRRARAVYRDGLGCTLQ